MLDLSLLIMGPFIGDICGANSVNMVPITYIIGMVATIYMTPER
jgi:hypothetical protein